MARDNKASRKAEASKPEAVLSIAEVAVLDGCSEKTVRRSIAEGLLEVIRIGPGGRLIRITVAAHATYRARRGR